MKIWNEVKSRNIDISVVESEKKYYPSYKVAINLKTENIKSSFNNYIWISEEDIDTFILELESLDCTRKGQAELQSISPGELNLIFKAIDNLGHLAVELRIKKEDRTSMDYSYDINISFQVESTILPSVVRDLKKIKE